MIRYLHVLLIGVLGSTFGCDEQLIIENEDPNLFDIRLVVERCEEETSFFFETKFVDAESDLVDLYIQVKTNDAEGFVYPGALGGGISGLTTSHAGTWHRVHWGVCPTEDVICPVDDRLLNESSLETCRCIDPLNLEMIDSIKFGYLSDQSSIASTELMSDFESVDYLEIEAEGCGIEASP